MLNETYAKIEKVLKENNEEYEILENGIYIFSHTIFHIKDEEIIVSFSAALNSSYVALKAIEYTNKFGENCFIGVDFYFSQRKSSFFHGDAALKEATQDIMEETIEIYKEQLEMNDFLSNCDIESKYTN